MYIIKMVTADPYLYYNVTARNDLKDFKKTLKCY